MGLGSVLIHENVGIVHGPNKKLYEETGRPVGVASCLVQACNVVVFIQDSHVPAKDRVLSVRTLIENCKKKAEDWLTWCSKPQAVVCSTVQAFIPHACSLW